MISKSVGPNSWDVGDSLLEIGEQSTAYASDALVRSVPAAQWKEIGLSLQRAPGDERWTVRSSDYCGVVRLETGAQLRVTPKIDGLDLFFLSDWAYGSKTVGKKLKDARVNLAALRTEPAACLLGWYVAEVLAFATRWLRRGYVVREEDLIGRVRGRIDVARYISRSVAQARPQVIPARFTEPSQDTPANRYLKAGLYKVAVLARSIPHQAPRRALEELTQRALALFGAVSDAKARPEDALRLNLSGPLRHYVQVTQFTTALLEGTYVSTEVGSHAQDAIMWSVNGLYEQALRNVLGAWPGAAFEKGHHRATVVDTGDGTANGSTPVKPDFVLRRLDGKRIILDAKYKNVVPRETLGVNQDESIVASLAGRQRVRIRRNDIYQAVAYGRHSGLQTDKVALLYPVALGASDPYPEPLKVHEFNPNCHVVFFDVGPGAESRRRELYRALEAI